MLHGAEYLDGALDAQLEDELAEVLRNLTVLAAIVGVAIDELHALTTSENLVH
jgi:hypothetical protein